MPRFTPRLLVIVLLPVALLVFAGLRLAGGFHVLGESFDAGQAQFTGSQACTDCHGERQDSWYATFHRTMTQEAGPHSVQGRFDGRELDYWGLRMRPVRDNGRYFFEYYDPESGEMVDRLRIERTVGSNRYQQYLTRLPEDKTYVRLHYLWHNADQRWVHMNAAFLGTDDRPFGHHVAIWNQNCIFCHNTGVEPRMTNFDELHQRAAAGEPVDMTRDGRFDSSVAELGISCETCHGPGAEHIERAGDFWQRMAMRLSPGRDTSIVNPVRLDHERSSQVCGQCHAQRLPREPNWIRDWIQTGPTFRPGMDLHEHVSPIRRDTRVPVSGREDLFRERFWADGTPRLSAYEYQGLLQSACHQEGELSCIDCHSMHGGDPAGQLTDRNRGNAPCLRCHQEYRGSQVLTDHTGHEPDSPGSVCYNCHMPHLAYGVMDIHRSHHIEIPDARRDASTGRPNACLNCHLEQSVAWAESELSRAGVESGPVATERFDGIDANLSDGVTVLAGDPVQKAVAAWRAGHVDNHLRGRERAWLVPYLLEAMGDIYPAIRRFSQNSLIAIVADWPEPEEVGEFGRQIERFDFMADAAIREQERLAALQAWMVIDKAHWPSPPVASEIESDYRIPEALRRKLIQLGRRLDKQISIGE